MEVTKVPEIIYHVQITLTEEDLCKMEQYVESGPKYTGAHEFTELVRKLRRAIDSV